MNKNSFTLLELIIYISIVSIILVIVGNFSWNIIGGGAKTSAYREVQQSGRLIMEKISRYIKMASDINSPTAGLAGNSLSLEMSDEEINPTVISLSGNNLVIAQGVKQGYVLNSSRVLVNNLEFTNISYVDTPGTIKIIISLGYNNPDNLREYQAEIDLENTISLAGN